MASAFPTAPRCDHPRTSGAGRPYPLGRAASPLVQPRRVRPGGRRAGHPIDKKSLGPAYKDTAKKYKGQNVAAKLAEKVKKGGQGVWGQVPMPPNASVPDADIKTLVKWVLSTK